MTQQTIFLPFPQPQQEAIFQRRPQRFLAEVQLVDGTDEVAYFANPGSMAGCLLPGSSALLWDSQDLKRKRRYTLRAIELDGIWIGADTHLSNRIVEKALDLKLIPGLETYSLVAREKLLEKGYRVDFVLTGTNGKGDCLLEVKSSVVVNGGIARYPDCRTPRGVRQLQVLKEHVSQGYRVVVLFLVQRADVHSFSITDLFDPSYFAAFQEAVAAGIEVIALRVTVSQEGFATPKLLSFFCPNTALSSEAAPVALAEAHDSLRTSVR
jgi:sugar fermentation stimulation protein A